MARSPEIFEEMAGAVESIGPQLKKKFTGIVKVRCEAGMARAGCSPSQLTHVVALGG
jgi:hypothetical protein